MRFCKSAREKLAQATTFVVGLDSWGIYQPNLLPRRVSVQLELSNIMRVVGVYESTWGVELASHYLHVDRWAK